MDKSDYKAVFLFLRSLQLAEDLFNEIPVESRPFSSIFSEALVSYACDLMGAAGVVALPDKDDVHES